MIQARVAGGSRCRAAAPAWALRLGQTAEGPDQLATANLTSAGGQPSESVVFEPRPRGAVVLAFRQGCVCLVAVVDRAPMGPPSGGPAP